MSFPGWLPDVLFQRDLPVTLPLPIKHERTYKDGSDGTILLGSGALWRSDWRFIDCGVRLSEGYGVLGSTPVLNVTLVQPNVFGVLLFDWFNPPTENRTAASIPLGVVTVDGDDLIASSPSHTPKAAGAANSPTPLAGGATVIFSEA